MFLFVDCFVLTIRALGIIALFQAVGAYLFVHLFRHELHQSERFLRSLVRWSALAGVLLGTLYYFLVRARMAGSFSGLGDPVLAGIVAGSSVHSAQVFAITGALAVAVAVSFHGGFYRLICLAGAMAIVISFALTGHTTTHDPGFLLAPLLVVHVAVAAAWFGALWPLRVVCARESREARAQIVSRFSRYAVRAVPVLFACGTLLAALFLRSIQQALMPYGMMLGLKIATFCGVLAIANYNRTRLVHAIADGQERSVSIFRQVLVGELLLLAAIVIVTVLMTGFFSP